MQNNRLCTCGSGLTYGACCGAKVNDNDDHVNRSRLNAYSGDAGGHRAEFCRSYSFHKRSALAEIAAELNQEAQAAGKAISCHNGCAACCRVYVVASLQECEAIVYYLYQHPDALRHFLGAFPSWRAGVEKIHSTFFDISRLQQKKLSRTDTPEDNAEFEAALTKYAEQNLDCPFLKDEACLVYDVRPYACAGLASTTPAEWCAVNHPYHKSIKLMKLSVNLDSDPPYFANQASKVSLTNMPALVYEILYYGWDFLCRVPGCAHLKSKQNKP